MSQEISCHGFNLRSVCWGYRTIFTQAIEGLYAEGLLGAEREDVTATFFEQLQRADQSCYDHVLKEFLVALNPRTKWLLELPGVFAEVTALGHRFAEQRVFYGIHYFRLLGEGAFGDSPAQVRHLVTLASQLLLEDATLALALLEGYRTLLERLEPPEIDLYVAEGRRLHHRSSGAGKAFLACTSKASETIIVSLTQECRLADVQGQLASLLRALVGYDVEVGDLGQLDADDLIERGSRVICLYRWLYLPIRVRVFDSADRNRSWYLLCGVCAAAMLAERTICAVHGHDEVPEPAAIIGRDPGRLNVFVVLEIVRALRAAQARWTGCRSLIRWGFSTEFAEAPPRHPAESLLQEIMLGDTPGHAARQVVETSSRLCNLFDTAAELDEPWARALADDLTADGQQIRAFAFLPDVFYRAHVDQAPPGALVADLKAQARQRRQEDQDQEEPPCAGHSADSALVEDGDDTSGAETTIACYWYPEWNTHENDYLEKWCGVHEPALAEHSATTIPADVQDLARRVSRVFERLRPTEAKREKRLDSGDAIDPDRLVAYCVQRRLEPNPPIDFYDKPLTSRRDLAVLILLDVSGSTGADHGQRKVLDIEKHAALVLGQGLHMLGDRFAVSGFSSNGREQCEYFRYKRFEESWNQAVMRRILGACPRSSTRMGPALRHSAWLLTRIEARQRLIILITDGQPMDNGYSPQTRYAQHDVRMACQENDRLGVATYAISTEENSLADLEIMFARRRFAVLPDIAALPKVLPKLYLNLTF